MHWVARRKLRMMRQFRWWHLVDCYCRLLAAPLALGVHFIVIVKAGCRHLVLTASGAISFDSELLGRLLLIQVALLSQTARLTHFGLSVLLLLKHLSQLIFLLSFIASRTFI